MEQVRQSGAAKGGVFAILLSVFLRQPQRQAAEPIQVRPETLSTFLRAVNLACALEETLRPLESRDG
jgi:hypothetical protein